MTNRDVPAKWLKVEVEVEVKKWLGSKSCALCKCEEAPLWFDVPAKKLGNRWAFLCLSCYLKFEGSTYIGQVYRDNFEKLCNVRNCKSYVEEA